MYDRAKDRRYGTLFFVLVLGFLGLAPLLWIACISLANLPDEAARVVVATIAMILAVLGILAVVRARLNFIRGRRRPNWPNASPLSSDEIAKARSKLRNDTTWGARAAPGAPQTYLKY